MIGFKKCLILVGIVAVVLSGTAFGEELADESRQIDVSVGYTFMTDYVWLGLNMTEDQGGSKGKGAHEMAYSLSTSTEFGRLGVTAKQVYYNSYVGTDASLAKTEITVSLTRPAEFIDGNLTLAWTNRKWENSAFLGETRSEEVSATLAIKAALNPTITYVLDYDTADNGQLFIVGLSHPIDLAEASPDLVGITLTPSATLIVDHRYYGAYLNNLKDETTNNITTKSSVILWGLNAGAKLCDNVSLNAGVVYVNGFKSVIEDLIYGYAGLKYSF